MSKYIDCTVLVRSVSVPTLATIHNKQHDSSEYKSISLSFDVIDTSKTKTLTMCLHPCVYARAVEYTKKGRSFKRQCITETMQSTPAGQTNWVNKIRAAGIVQIQKGRQNFKFTKGYVCNFSITITWTKLYNCFTNPCRPALLDRSHTNQIERRTPSEMTPVKFSFRL